MFVFPRWSAGNSRKIWLVSSHKIIKYQISDDIMHIYIYIYYPNIYQLYPRRWGWIYPCWFGSSQPLGDDRLEECHGLKVAHLVHLFEVVELLLGTRWCQVLGLSIRNHGPFSHVYPFLCLHDISETRVISPYWDDRSWTTIWATDRTVGSSVWAIRWEFTSTDSWGLLKAWSPPV